MNRETKRKVSRRIFVLELLFGMAFLLLAAKAVTLQVIDADQLTVLADKDQTITVHIQGQRGDILDRNMKKLSTSLDAVSIAAAPVDVKTPEKAAGRLASLLDMDRDVVFQKLTSGKSFVWVKKKLPPEMGPAVKKLGIKGVFPLKDAVRFHPSRELAAQIIGMTTTDHRGKEGLEFKFDSLLCGRKETLRLRKNTMKSVAAIQERFKGDSLVLTIDKTIQYIAENALKDAVESSGARSGMAVVMRPDTGEVLAMAHVPLFNPNAYNDFDQNSWRNRAVTDAFEPGSTMKIFLAAAALDQGFSTPDSLFDCENGRFTIKRKTIRDTHPHGWLTLSEIIRVSSNIGVAKIALIMGEENLYTALTRFGFGNRTAVSCPGETRGTLRPADQWSSLDTASIAFGQGMSTSAIQLACAVSAIANKGVLMKPRLIRTVIGPDGVEKKSYAPARVRQAVSSRTAKAVTRMMQSVVQEGGTGTRARLPGYRVCGKTGTAQKARTDGKGYAAGDYTALFVGFAPADAPQLAAAVIIDEPRTSHYGGVVAAPAFKTILQKSFNYLNIPPDLHQTQPAPGVNGA